MCCNSIYLWVQLSAINNKLDALIGISGAYGNTLLGIAAGEDPAKIAAIRVEYENSGSITASNVRAAILQHNGSAGKGHTGMENTYANENKIAQPSAGA